MLSGVPAGLRERKKRKTRDEIVRAAMALFAERGFERTTIADIAAAADISPRTFFGYFPTKEDVVFHDSAALMESLDARVRQRPEGETALDALRAWIVLLDEAADLGSPEETARRRLVRETPALAARDRADLGKLEALLAEEVAGDLGVPADSLRPHLVSAAAVAALDALGRRSDSEAGRSQPAGAVLDEAFAFLRGGLEALRER
jgi:AcrR family transcriptional regulator